MDKLETQALSTAQLKPSLYKRHIEDVDDGLLVGLHGLHELHRFIDHLNVQHDKITFKLEHHKNDKHSIILTSASPYHTSELWHSGVHLSFMSAQSMQMKLSLATNQFIRAAMNSSTHEANEYSQGIIVDLLSRNAFPLSVIHAATNKVKHSMNERQKNRTRRQECFNAVLKLPFVSDSLTNRVSRHVRQFTPDFKVVFYLDRL